MRSIRMAYYLRTRFASLDRYDEEDDTWEPAANLQHLQYKRSYMNMQRQIKFKKKKTELTKYRPRTPLHTHCNPIAPRQTNNCLLLRKRTTNMPSVQAGSCCICGHGRPRRRRSTRREDDSTPAPALSTLLTGRWPVSALKRSLRAGLSRDRNRKQD